MESIKEQTEQFDRLCEKMSERIKAGKRVFVKDMKEFRKLEKALSNHIDKSDDSMVYSFRQAEKYCGINRGNLHRYAQQGRLKRHGQGFLKTDLDRLVRERKNPAPRYPVHENIRKEQLKYRKWKARREELIVKLMQGKLLDRSDVEGAWVSRAYELSRALLVLSRRVSHKIAAISSNEYKFVSNIIDDEVRLFMDTYSSGVKYPQ